MHQTKKGNQCPFGMKVHTGVDKDSGLIHSVVVTVANVHDLTPAADLLHGDEQVVYDDSGDQGIAKRPEMACAAAEFRVAMRPGKRRALPNTPEGKLQDLIETAKAHIRANGRIPIPGYQAAVRLSKKPGYVAWPYRGHRPSVAEPREPLQAQCAGSVDEFVPCTPSATVSSVKMDKVCPSTSIQAQMPVRGRRE